ncbi:putative membrane protein [Breoghania corrubedonensis]|uniref:Putative membrane protein n=2 Tax=Breoghania corrubedonensis TaxID=665038 RepID=A0A2T5VHP8_9HYPH|nr:putative membrane protein [Breoghania corrubedonensis]
MLVLVGISFTAGLFCIAIGAWPVFGFFGLDVALVWFAFRQNYRDARAFEEIHVSIEEVVLRKVSSRGEVQLYRFNPAWVRIEVTRIEDEGVTGLRLRSHGRAVAVGEFLNPADREDFSRALGSAFASARRGGPAAGSA